MSQISPSRTHLKRRIDDYLWRSDEMPIQRLRNILSNYFLPHGDVAIIGGLIRDLARRGPSGFKSDIDLVIDSSPRSVERIARQLGATKNRFGGFGLRTPLWKIDFWALRNTWAHRHGYAKITSLGDLTNSTFFNIDAVIYIINSRELIAKECYVGELLSRKLEINLLPNPSVEGNALRAVRRLLAWNMRPGVILSNFLKDEVSDRVFRYIVDTEVSLYGFSYASRYEDRNMLLDGLLNWKFRTPLNSDNSDQYHFPF